MLRTHSCEDLDRKLIGQSITLAGWAQAIRDHGGVTFIDLRDRSGIVQVVFRKSDLSEKARALGLESCFQVTGHLQKRPQGTENPEMATGTLEVEAESIVILNHSKPLPFMVAAKTLEASEETRLKYRYIDLRRPKMQKAMRKRHEFTQAVRNFLTQEGFWEIETPILTKSTPEGARDFLVPSRLNSGTFYALPQSPQIFKQMLMVSGMEKYFQIARCFRDEDLRADRQLEHTQIDIEMSFVEAKDIWSLVERMLSKTIGDVFGVKLSTPFEQLSFQEADAKYQTDKPDLRFREFLRFKLDPIFEKTSFKVFSQALASKKSIYGLKIPNAKDRAGRGALDRSVSLAKALGAQGLIWIKAVDGALESPIEKFLSADEKNNINQLIKPGDLLFVCAEEANLADRVLKDLQKSWAETLGFKPQEAHAWAWVYDFPLLEYIPEEKRWQATHNPFTAPKPEDMALLESAPEKARSCQYDIVLNGMELGSGSIRNHSRETQTKIFKLMGYTQAEIDDRFGWMLEALDFGAPPHGGVALGIDRILSIFLNEDSIREVIAFPKTQRGTCPFSGAPTPVDTKQLKELGIKLQ